MTPDLVATVLTVSDSCAAGKRRDESGPSIVSVLSQHGFRVVASRAVPDDQREIQKAIVEFAAKAQLIITTGGTGIALRDVTPEATRAVCERFVDGIPERMRHENAAKTPFAALSRGLCGVRGQSLVLNLPGSPKGAVESLNSVIDLIPHMLQLLRGDTEHNQQ